MTLQELEILVKQIQSQVQLNTVAINQLSSRFNSYVTLTSFNNLESNVENNNSTITLLKQQIAELQSSSNLIGKLNKLLDVNIIDLTKNDILQFDGDRWTNIKPENIVSGSQANASLENLIDVNITNKQDGQALCWNNSVSKWVNKTISASGGMDIDVMWNELAKSSDKQIHPSHIKGPLTINGLTVNGDSQLTSGNNSLIISSAKNEVKGDLIGLNEITAYG